MSWNYYEVLNCLKRASLSWISLGGGYVRKLQANRNFPSEFVWVEPIW